MVTGDIGELFNRSPIDCCVIATNSFVKEVFPKIMLVLNHSINVVTIAEEMSWPGHSTPTWRARWMRRPGRRA